MRRILVLTKYDDLGASSRVRFLQYIEYYNKMHSEKVSFDVYPLLCNNYVNSIYGKGKLSRGYLLKKYFTRLFKVLKVWQYDVIWLEKELFPYLPSFLETCIFSVLRKKVVVDYDDAIFHNYDLSSNRFIRTFLSKKIDNVMQVVSHVVVGNDYIASRSKNLNTTLIPTVIDHSKYDLEKIESSSCGVRIGWIGTPYTQKYIVELANVFERISNDHNFTLVLIGADNSIIKYFNKTNLEIIEWRYESEIENLNSIDVGIMPLPDEPFENGKCGYKLIQYLGVGKPVIGSNVGVNGKIIKACRAGFVVDNISDWEIRLIQLIEDESLRVTLSSNAKKNIEKLYSIESQAEKLLSIICS